MATNELTNKIKYAIEHQGEPVTLTEDESKYLDEMLNAIEAFPTTALTRPGSA